MSLSSRVFSAIWTSSQSAPAFFLEVGEFGLAAIDLGADSLTDFVGVGWTSAFRAERASGWNRRLRSAIRRSSDRSSREASDRS